MLHWNRYQLYQNEDSILQHSSQNRNLVFYVRILHMIIKTCLDLLHGQTLQNTNAINFIQPSCCPVTEAAFSLHLSPAVAVICRFYELRLSVREERTQPDTMYQSIISNFWFPAWQTTLWQLCIQFIYYWRQIYKIQLHDLWPSASPTLCAAVIG